MWGDLNNLTMTQECIFKILCLPRYYPNNCAAWTNWKCDRFTQQLPDHSCRHLKPVGSMIWGLISSFYQQSGILTASSQRSNGRTMLTLPKVHSIHLFVKDKINQSLDHEIIPDITIIDWSHFNRLQSLESSGMWDYTVFISSREQTSIGHLADTGQSLIDPKLKPLNIVK